MMTRHTIGYYDIYAQLNHGNLEVALPYESALLGYYPGPKRHAWISVDEAIQDNHNDIVARIRKRHSRWFR